MDLSRLIIIAGCFLSLFGNAQQTSFDSLIKASAGYNGQDEKKLRLLNRLSQGYQYRQIDSGIACANRAIVLAQKLNNPKELASAFNNKAINSIQAGNLIEAGKLLREALTLNTLIKNNTGIADNYLNIGILCYFHGDPDSTNTVFAKSIALYRQTGQKNGMANALYYIAFMKMPDSESLILYHKAIALYKQAGNEAGVSMSYNGIGCYFEETGDYTRSLEWFNKAITLNRQNNLSFNLALDYSNICSVYLDLALYPKHLDYELKALRIAEKIGAHMLEGSCLGGLGHLYLELKQYPEALKYLTRVKELSEPTGNLNFLSYIYNKIGTIYSKMNEPGKAFEYFEKALKISIRQKNDKNLSLCYAESGRAYWELKQYDKAILNFKKGINLDTNVVNKDVRMQFMYDLGKCITDAPEAMLLKAGINPANRTKIAIVYFQQVIVYADINVKRDAFFELSRMYEQKGDTGKSFNYFKQYVVLKDSIMNAENSKSLSSSQIQYDTEKKEQEIALLSKDKQIQLQEINKQKLMRNGFIAGFTVVLLFAGLFFRQRNKIKKGNAALQIAKDRAERSEQFKQQFLANMSHEIRTPMNAVMGMTSLVLDTPLAEKQKFYLEGIRKSGDTLLHIINDILDLSKIEAGKMELEKIDFSLSDTLKQVKQTLNHRAEEKGLELLINIEPGIDDVAIGDPVRLNQVLINLAGNAIKFTEKGSVTIEVKQGDHETALQFSIIDTGIGIPQEKLKTVFEEFSQVNASDTRKYGGTGLGLSISRQLVELMGGKITIASKEGSGTTFSFIVTCEKGSVERLEQRLASEEQVDGHILDGLKILVVDDNEYNRIVAKDTLESKSSAEVVAAGSALEALELLKAKDFDVVLMDVQMPVMNGFEATRQIRNAKSEMRNLKSEMRTGAKRSSAEPNSDVPIIALTASVLRTDLDKCTAAGMDGYIPKPFRASQLIIGIALVLNIELKAEKKIESRNINPVSSSGNVTDLAYLTKFCEGDQARMKKYIEMFLASVPQLLEKIKIATENNDHLEIANQLHGFKTKFLMMGMKEAKELAAEIEMKCRQENNLEDAVVLMLQKIVRQVETAVAELKTT